MAIAEPIASVNGSWKAATMVSARFSTAALSAASSMSNPNSSPPSRAAVPRPVVSADSRIPAATSSSSPTLCPMVSLITLKSSRSMKSTPTTAPVGRARAIARTTRSWNSIRLGIPVSESWKARYLSSRSSWRCSVTSRRVSTRPPTVGSCRRSLHLTSTST